MNSRQRIKSIIAGEPADRCGFWLGNPHPDSWPALHQYFGTSSEEELRLLLKDDFRWITPWDAYQHPEGKPVFDMQRPGKTLSEGGVFADTVSVEEVEAFDWPNPEYLDFSKYKEILENTGDFYRAGGLWSPFFHEVCDFFGMENYFLKMYLNPDVVHAVTRHLIEYYLAANRLCFEECGDLIDGFFFGNDFGSQIDILVSPELFKEFIFPYFKDLTDLGKAFNKQVILHSCGSIFRVMDDLIGLGVNAFHPLQAKAANMDADTLQNHFAGKIAFIGAIDTQDLLVNGSPDDVIADVRRIKRTLGPSVVISPSHEALLPNVSPENIEAMAIAATES
ncbi:MAG: uroporphyrinogen decarboxylase family protein [Candidatus Stygibacter australis]|nr:uroporphyrinogen decarboxylase family protein [Candidatus Stygibacter australis]MDP8322094.1 uroporphyrinogen decarboxylase family protein [Candidatus Stygibacter australis]